MKPSPTKKGTQAPGAVTTAETQEQAPSGTLAAVALANIAAQPRFAKHAPDAAAKAALELWQECQAVIDAYRRRQRDEEARDKERRPIPQPKQWPAKLEDFCRRIIRAKDKTERQSRLEDFLLWRRNELRRTVEYDPYDMKEGPKPPLVKGTKKASDALEHDLKVYEEIAPKKSWDALAEDYQAWWEAVNREKKRAAGLAGALSPKRKRKVTEHEGNVNLAAAIMGPEETASAAKRKKRVSRLKKKHSAP